MSTIVDMSFFESINEDSPINLQLWQAKLALMDARALFNKLIKENKVDEMTKEEILAHINGVYNLSLGR